jgi:heme-degrading monooxygenase HmoA
LRYRLGTLDKGCIAMITEIAQIDVKPGQEKDFEAAVAMAQTIFKRCKGWKSFELHRSIEKPSRYRLHITWETLENHTVDFRESENFTEWRGLVGPHFAEPPQVEHTNTVLRF